MKSPMEFAVVRAMSLAGAMILAGTAFGQDGAGDRPTPEETRSVILEDLDGRSLPLVSPEGTGPTVVCFLGVECPLARLYAPGLSRLTDEFPDVRFLGINGNRQDSVEEIRRYLQETGLQFPFVKDHDARVVDLLGATRTPEAVVLDAWGVVRYRGRIDDRYQPGLAKGEPTREDLRIALTELTSGRVVSVPETIATGCLIGRGPRVSTPTSLTFCREISRILQRHCVECHRTGDIGPFALTDYEEVQGWGEMILEVIEDGRMPPWHAASGHVALANAREMPEADKQALREWVAGGMPFGDAQELPAPIENPGGWRLGGDPDQVVAMSSEPYSVPGEGVVEYQYFVADPGFTEDVWVNAAEVRPGDRSVVHHCIVFIRPPDGKELTGAGFLSAYVPGQRATTFPQGYARRIPAGSRLVFQMHYTPTGTPRSDRTEIGLRFLPASAVTHEVSTVIGINRDFEIPPHAEGFPVSGETDDFDRTGTLLAITPHMHYRGRSVTVSVDRAGSSEVLLEVPKYDFNWQHVYELANAVPLNAVDRLSFTCRFDNTKENPTNPDPSVHVTWGDQSWEEMAIVFFEVARPRGDGLARHDATVAPETRIDPVRRQRAVEFADRFFARFDADGDRLILREELPEGQRRFGFFLIDRDRDERLTRQEIEDQAYEDLR